MVVADHRQRGGVGRGRVWEAPVDGSLLLAVLLRPPAAVAGLTTMVLALAASDAVAALTGVEPGLKWPNDLVWPGDGSAVDRKLAGILAEAEWPPGVGAASGPQAPGTTQRAAVQAGIGLNVAWGDRYPEELRATAVALDEIVAEHRRGRDGRRRGTRRGARPGGPPGGPAAVARRGTGCCCPRVEPTAVLDRWRSRSATLGRRVRVDLGVDDIEGTAIDVADEGHLVLELAEGGRRVVAVGDVVHLRPT